MYIDEFLIKVGVDATQAGKINDVINQLSRGANKLGENANEIANNIKRTVDNVSDGADKLDSKVNETEKKTSKLKLGLLALVAVSVFVAKSLVSAFNGAIDKAAELYTKKNALFKISTQELLQAKQYKDAMSKAGLAIDSVKTKIALNLAPSITNIINSFNKWLVANKELIVNGIGAAIKAVGYCIQVVVNFFRLIDKVITGTIGWKNALGVLAVAWAVFNRALLFSPLGIVIGLITGLLLLIDDLMVYMSGGNSFFGEYWQPLIDGAKAAWGYIKKFWNFLQTVWKLLKSIWDGDLDGIAKHSKEIWTSVSNVVKSVFDAIVGFVANAAKKILMYFGMSEDDATRVVNAIGIIFQMIFGFITAPFRAAWKLISSLFDVWGDDSLSFTDKLNKTFDVIKDFLFAPFKAGWELVKKLFSSFGIDAGKVVGDIGKSFASVFDKIVAPFKRAKSWISDVFGTFVGGIMKKVNKALSLIGMGSKDDGNVEQPNDNGENYKAFMKTLQPVLSIDTSLPAYPQSSTKNTAVNQSMNNNITINTSDTKTGVDQASNFLLEQLKIANNNAKSGLGVN